MTTAPKTTSSAPNPTTSDAKHKAKAAKGENKLRSKKQTMIKINQTLQENLADPKKQLMQMLRKRPK